MNPSRLHTVLRHAALWLVVAIPAALFLAGAVFGQAGSDSARETTAALAPTPGLFMPYVMRGSGSTLPPPTSTPPPVDPTPSPTPNPTPQAIPVPNGSFEQGPNGDWDELVDGQPAPGALILQPGGFVVPHGGEFVAWLGGVNDETNTLSQTVPVDVELPTRLRFWYQIRSDEGDNCRGDEATLTVNGQLLRTWPLCRPEETDDWVRELVDLSSFAGQDLTITFNATFDRARLSSFFVDDVSLRTIP